MDIAEPTLYISIECDGPSHLSKQAKVDDFVRDILLGEIGWTTVRVTYDEIGNDISAVLHKIQRVINLNAPLLTSELEGGLVYPPAVREKKRPVSSYERRKQRLYQPTNRKKRP